MGYGVHWAPIVKNGTKYEKKEHIPAGVYSPVFLLSD